MALVVAVAAYECTHVSVPKLHVPYHKRVRPLPAPYRTCTNRVFTPITHTTHHNSHTHTTTAHSHSLIHTHSRHSLTHNSLTHSQLSHSHTHLQLSLSLSLTHTHTHTHVRTGSHSWPPTLYVNEQVTTHLCVLAGNNSSVCVCASRSHQAQRQQRTRPTVLLLLGLQTE
jgi:hypothetical protein